MAAGAITLWLLAFLLAYVIIIGGALLAALIISSITLLLAGVYRFWLYCRGW